jgi:hypothetical protein
MGHRDRDALYLWQTDDDEVPVSLHGSDGTRPEVHVVEGQRSKDRQVCELLRSTATAATATMTT